MWPAERKFLRYRGFVDVIQLGGYGHSSAENLPYHEIDPKAWQRRVRVVYPVPLCIRNSYIHLSSQTFRRFIGKQDNTDEDIISDNIIPIGDVGLNFVLDDSKKLGISIEAHALLQLVNTEGKQTVTPNWLFRLRKEWVHGMSLFVFNSQTGWRGCFAEYKLWVAILMSENVKVKTPYSTPVIRSWFSLHVINDLYECLGKEHIMNIAETISHLGFDGAPDLLLYKKNPPLLWFVEVKSATDCLRSNQLNMMQHLSKHENTTCQICCPSSALKRFATVSLYEEDSDTP